MPSTSASSRAGPSHSAAWLHDYGAALEVAQWEARMLLICFREPGAPSEPDAFEHETLSKPEVATQLHEMILVKVPLDATIRLNGEEVVLVDHPSFAEMQGLPGIAMVDFRDPEAPYYGSVVSTFPLLRGRRYTLDELRVILDLPAGTLTQRTLIYALRVHPERPASTEGEFHPELVNEAEAHSSYQAQIRLQGHHRWESRFRRICGRLSDGLIAKEVCAESWPGEGLLEGAIECVRCWRTSPGHWGAVRAGHPYYGYDMKRGSNGVWYATGIFAAHSADGRG